MNCPKCGSEQISVINSRPEARSVKRRRMCHDCLHRFSTTEGETDKYEKLKKSAASFEKLLTLVKILEV